MTPFWILVNWVFFGVSNALLGASIMMLWKGTMPPPFTHVKVKPIIPTAILVVGVTMMLQFGKTDLLEATIKLLTGAK